MSTKQYILVIGTGDYAGVAAFTMSEYARIRSRDVRQYNPKRDSIGKPYARYVKVRKPNGAVAVQTVPLRKSDRSNALYTRPSEVRVAVKRAKALNVR